MGFRGQKGEMQGLAAAADRLTTLTTFPTTLTTMKWDIVFMVFCVCVMMAGWIGGLMVEGWMWGQLGWKGMAFLRLVVEPIAEFLVEVAVMALGA